MKMTINVTNLALKKENANSCLYLLDPEKAGLNGDVLDAKGSSDKV